MTPTCKLCPACAARSTGRFCPACGHPIRLSPEEQDRLNDAHPVPLPDAPGRFSIVALDEHEVASLLHRWNVPPVHDDHEEAR